MAGAETTLFIAAGAVALIAAAAVAAHAVHRRPRFVAYTAEEAAHVAETGVPPQALELARNPVSGEIARRRRRVTTSATGDVPAPLASKGAPSSPSGYDDADVELHQMIQDTIREAAAPVPVPDYVPGSAEGAYLPASFASSSWSEKLLDAHASNDVDQLAELAVRYRPLAWVAHLLVLTLEHDANGLPLPSSVYEEHLVAGYASLKDLEHVGDTHEDPRLSDLRGHLSVRARLPLHHAVALVPCTPPGLRLAHAAYHLAQAQLPSTDVLELAGRDLTVAHREDPYALTTLLLIDQARHLDAPLPAYSARRNDQWGLLLAMACLHLVVSRDDPDSSIVRKDATRRLGAAPSADLRVDVSTLASVLGVDA